VDKANVEAERTGQPGEARRIAIVAVALAAIAGLAGMALGGGRSSAGAVAGALAAGLYAVSYVRTHLSRDPHRLMDGKVLAQGGVRILLVAAGALAMLLAGRSAFLAFVIAFAGAFPLLVVSEIPRALRMIRRRGAEG
jgi:hypothetical protein